VNKSAKAGTSDVSDSCARMEKIVGTGSGHPVALLGQQLGAFSVCYP
jgi:hypothetical protein